MLSRFHSPPPAFICTKTNCTPSFLPRHPVLYCAYLYTFSRSPWEAESWTFHGPLTTVFGTTSGASLLIRDDTAAPTPTHYAIITTANTAGGLYTATSTDLLNWDVNTTAWCKGRRGKFDQKGMVRACTMRQGTRCLRDTRANLCEQLLTSSFFQRLQINSARPSPVPCLSLIRQAIIALFSWHAVLFITPLLYASCQTTLYTPCAVRLVRFVGVWTAA